MCSLQAHIAMHHGECWKPNQSSQLTLTYLFIYLSLYILLRCCVCKNLNLSFLYTLLYTPIMTNKNQVILCQFSL